MNPTLVEKRSLEQEQSGCKNSNKIKFLEVIYVADPCAIELYGLIDLPDMLLSVSNIVRMNVFFSKIMIIYYFLTMNNLLTSLGLKNNLRN